MNSRGSGASYIGGRFALTERLGRTGRVWRAYDTQNQYEVAMRELLSADADLVDDDPIAADSLRRRVLQEAGALAQLRHPNIVTILDLVDAASASHPWLVMELVVGGSLEDHLTRRLLTPHEAASVGRSVLAALAATRAIGIVHRNLKPSNVLLRPDGTPLLTDFALTTPRDAGRQAASGTLIGSPDYIAPERVRGEEGDPASDLWSLGMVLYVAVTGRNPLRRGTDLATMAAVLDEPLPPPRQAGPLAPVLAALLVRDPVARPGFDVLDRMLSDAERDQVAWNAPPAPGADPFAESGSGYRERQDRQPSWTPSSAQSAAALPAKAESASAPALAPKRASSEPPRRGGRRVAVAVAGIAAMGLVGALLWVVTGGGSANATGDQGTNQAGGPGQTSGSSTASSSAVATNLLTTAGISTVISAMTQAIGSSQVLQLTVFSTYATAEVPDKTTSGTYDNYSYSGGPATIVTTGQTPAGDVTMNMNSINWNVLPGLLQAAAADLGVQNPTAEYIVMDPNWPQADSGPTLRVYLSNAVGTGYLLSDGNGNIMKTYPIGH